MCGIFAYLGNDEKDTTVDYVDRIEKLEHRGPDSTIWCRPSNNIFLGFTRLRINDTSTAGEQPMIRDTSTFICNGEIYNHSILQKEHNVPSTSGSDCEVIGNLYNKYHDPLLVASSLDGVFACIVWDEENNKGWAARDPLGVRAMYYSNENGKLAIASEIKSLYGFNNVKPFPPGHVGHIECKDNMYTISFERYIDLYGGSIRDISEEDALVETRTNFINAVKKRMMSDRPIGCLLSGGLDSSLVASILAREMHPRKLQTFSIGMPGATDLGFAKVVADYLGTDHKEYVVTEEELLNNIDTTIYSVESYDTTTIRASTPMVWLAKKIKEETDITVVYSGEGSDEASGSYLYFHNAPDDMAFHNETVRLIGDLHRFDVLRCDKSIASGGLEVRVPFLDKRFMTDYMSLPPSFKRPREGRIEKYLLRKAFDGYLPDSVLWRQKEGMSDGVSSNERPWYTVIKEHVQKNEEADLPESPVDSHNPPKLLETRWYRHLFDKHFPDRANTIPYYWLPRWVDTDEPSARTLKVHEVNE